MRNHLAVELIAVKVLLAPGFVVVASLTARRYGPRIGGLIAGLPVVAGPILLIYALEHGPAFAASAAAGTLLGLVSLIAFVIVYGRLAWRVFWAASMIAGWAAFIAGTLIFSTVSVSAEVALGSRSWRYSPAWRGCRGRPTARPTTSCRPPGTCRCAPSARSCWC